VSRQQRPDKTTGRHRPGHDLPRVAILTLGCPKNVVDSEHIASLLQAAGVEVSTDPTSATVAVVNTCGFIQPAKEESIRAILDVAGLKRSGGLKALIVTGCLPERYGDELRQAMPEADVLVGIDPPGAARAALVALGADGAVPSRCNVRARRLTPPWWSYLRIAEGCDNRCAYCAIPSIRGPLVSRPLNGIVREARYLLESGAKELNIIAQDTTAYGMDMPPAGAGKRGAKGRQLHLLLRRICALRQDKWLRLLYTHPAHYYPELIEVLASEPDICPYLDIPLQHISDRILRRMGRKVTADGIGRLLECLRARMPGLTLRTTFMVGFPGETDEEFQELLDFVRQAKFDRLGAFTYWREEGTPAARLRGQVPEDVKEERFHELMTLQQEIACRLAAQREGELTDVLVEAAGTEGEARPAGPTCRSVPAESAWGRSRSEAPDVDPVIFIEDASGLKAGDLARVRIVGSAEYDCVARLVSS